MICVGIYKVFTPYFIALHQTLGGRAFWRWFTSNFSLVVSPL